MRPQPASGGPHGARRALLAGRFAVVRRLGGGGQADVYLALDQRRGGQRVAVKALRADRANQRDARARLQREAELLRRLARHPGIVNLIDYQPDAEPPFLVTAFVAGGTLRERLDSATPIPPAVLRRWISQLGGSMDVVHRYGVLHRDLDPQNVLVTAVNGDLVICDLGIADVRDARSLTRLGHVVGRPTRLAPEQSSGAKATRRSDVYQLGLLLGDLVAGGRYGPGSATGHGERVDRVLRRATAADPTARHGSGKALATALLAAMDQRPVRARTPARRPPNQGDATAVTRLLARPQRAHATADGGRRRLVAAYHDNEAVILAGLGTLLVIVGVVVGRLT